MDLLQWAFLGFDSSELLKLVIMAGMCDGNIIAELVVVQAVVVVVTSVHAMTTAVLVHVCTLVQAARFDRVFLPELICVFPQHFLHTLIVLLCP